MAAVKTAVASMIERAVSALYDADTVGGMYADDLIPIVTATGDQKRAKTVLNDLVEAERLIQAAGSATHGGPHGARYKLSPSERSAEFMRRFSLYNRKRSTSKKDGGTYD
jgi:hypothetical protein